VLSPLPAPAAAAGCPDVLTLFSKHLENEIDASTCEKMERHLESCPRCRHRCDSLKGTLALCRTAGAHAEVPDSVKSSLRIALHDFLSVQG
jgi:RNA polymerase sigma-70 factor (ECF subfamily)